MTSRLIHCSQCGEEGHNKRNNKCRVNIATRLERYNIVTEKILSIRNMNCQITQILEQQRIVLPLEEMIFSCLLMLQYVCATIKDIRVITHAVASVTLHLEDNIRKLNRILMLYQEPHPTAFYELGAIQLNYIPYPSILCRSVYLLEPLNSYFTITGNILSSAIVRQLIRPQNAAHFIRPNKKRTIEYLKEMTVEHENATQKQVTTSQSSEHNVCPICLTEIEHHQSIYTQCNHVFCASCMKDLTTSIKDNTTEPSCPLCRSTITKLVTENHELCLEMSNHLTSL